MLGDRGYVFGCRVCFGSIFTRALIAITFVRTICTLVRVYLGKLNGAPIGKAFSGPTNLTFYLYVTLPFRNIL